MQEEQKTEKQAEDFRKMLNNPFIRFFLDCQQQKKVVDLKLNGEEILRGVIKEMNGKLDILFQPENSNTAMFIQARQLLYIKIV